MDRPFFKASIEELEQLLHQRGWDKFTLSRLREELTYRTTDRAKQLLREVAGLLDGTVPERERPLKEESPEDQIDLLGEK